MVTQDLTAGGLALRAGDMINIDIHRLGNNPNEWREPGTFIPDRFDSDSKYFLTPGGKHRNSASFTPFLGGQRSCIGKTFV